MLLKHDLFPISGYLGYLKAPCSRSSEPLSVFAITDQNREELNVIILQPGSYNTVMHFAQLVHFRRINIFSISYDIGFISDIYRIARDLHRYMKRGVYTVFPESFPMTIDPVTKMSHLKMTTYSSQIDPNISIQYLIHSENCEQRELCPDHAYDIIVYLGNKKIIFPTIMKEEYLEEIQTAQKTEIHLPYNSTLYGGLSYSDILDGYQKRKYSRKVFEACKVNCFASTAEYTFCKNRGDVHMIDIINMSLK